MNEERSAAESGKDPVLNVIVREVREDHDIYYVSECLELPGCVSEGSTPDEARSNIRDAIRLCLSVVFEDRLRELTADHVLPDLTNIVKQSRITVHATPELEYA